MGTEANLRKGFSLGNWEVLPDRSLIRDGSNEVRVEPLPMNVLVALAENPGEVLTKDDLVDRVWGGRAIADGPILRAISQLRRALGDDRSEPTYIENIPRIGYRLLVPVVPHESRPADAEPAPAPTLPVNLMLGIVVLVAVAALGWFFSCSLFRVGCPAPTPSLAVHRFECTSATAEHFCRGFSEELVSSLLESGRVKIVKLRVPIPSPPCDEQYRVDWTVGGSVQQLNGVIKASAEIVNCADGTVRRQINEQAPEIGLFGLQKRVAGLISESLLPQDPPPIELASEPQNDDAYILYVQGRAQLEQRSRFAIERSIESFMQSIELDPGYGPAHLQLAHAYLLMPEYNAELDTRDYYARAEQAIARGIDADDAIR
ncbi:MAG: winged helix-turn-helix domain-containing protein, partial [Woeseiaceae bacterium]|nr:winged helix-turn-helix domain-containing protein [Woeseiaceae bacterium]